MGAENELEDNSDGELYDDSCPLLRMVVVHVRTHPDLFPVFSDADAEMFILCMGRVEWDEWRAVWGLE